MVPEGDTETREELIRESPRTGYSAPPSGSGCMERAAWVVGLLLLSFIVLPFTPLGRPLRDAVFGVARIFAPEPEKEIVTERVEVPVVKEVIKEVPAAPPELPKNFVPYRKIEVGEIFNGMHVQTEIDATEGGLASLEREDAESYGLSFKLQVRVPKAARTLEEVTASSPSLAKALPGLPDLLKTAEVSPFYHLMYESKAKDLGTRITRLERALSRHNYYDLQTILQLQHPTTGQKALLMMSEMDVVSDGSDGDRMAQLDDYISMSSNYQPFTSYGWPKTTKTPNPLLTRYEKELAEKKERYAVKGLSAEENSSLHSRIGYIERALPDLRSRSFLIAEADPFAVVSLAMLGYTDRDPFAPNIGDYCVVIYGDRIFPAILGDAGPRTKVGEASLRMAKELNPDAGVYRRPVNDLAVTYLIFPGSAKKPFRAPDLDAWHTACQGFLDRLGGVGEGFSLHRWEDHFKKDSSPTSTP